MLLGMLGLAMLLTGPLWAAALAANALATGPTGRPANTSASVPASPAAKKAKPARKPTAGTPPATASAEPAPPMRLSADVQPLAYSLALTIDPAQPQHSGTVQIDLQLRQPTRRLRLHAKDLQIQQVALDVGARRLAGQVRRLDADNIALQFGQTVPAGPARLTIGFTGRLQDKEVYGLFRQQEAGQWAAFTQFESTGARLAFPLFDEPGWKVPWTLALTVPQPLLAVANMPIASEEPAQPGWKTVRFAPTPPLPSYLLAFAVGDFEAVDAGTTGGPAPQASQTPMRIITPRGRSADAAYAASVTRPIVERLEAYFGLPHPYPKLDSLAIPLTVNFGAMENAGLITYRSTRLLASPAAQTPQFQRNYVATAAHELAHQWFGNLVTPAWWDDIWLNESFASWLGDRITAELQPTWGWDTAVQQARQQAMRADRLLSARRIAEPVRNPDELAAVWDSITYQKGQVVLAMFEQWLGPARFQAGVQRYITRHAWGHATGHDFLAALAVEDPTLPEALRSFTQQPGIPRIQADLLCSDGPPRLRLRQSRLLALGSAAAAGTASGPAQAGAASGPAKAPVASDPASAGMASLWQVPMLIRTPAGLSRLLLTTPEATLALPDATCPPWVQANAGGVGYYRVATTAQALAALLAQADLPVAERLAGLDDGLGLSEAGDLPLADMLALAEVQAQHPDRRVVEQAMQVLSAARRLITPGDPSGQTTPAAQTASAAYSAQWQRAVGSRARALGWRPLPTDSDDDRLLRSTLLPALAELGDDSALQTEARALTERWLTEPSSLDAALRAAVLASAALRGDAALFDALRAALAGSSDRSERRDLISALGHFKTPALAERARALLLDEAIDIREAQWPLLRPQSADPAQFDGLLRFMQQHHADLVRRLGRDEPAWLPEHLDQACGEDDARRIDAVFAPFAKQFQGAARVLAQTLESVRLCAAWRAATR